MTTVAIPLSEERLAQLQLRAQQVGLSPEEFLRRRVEPMKAPVEAAAVATKAVESIRRLE